MFLILNRLLTLLLLLVIGCTTKTNQTPLSPTTHTAHSPIKLLVDSLPVNGWNGGLVKVKVNSFEVMYNKKKVLVIEDGNKNKYAIVAISIFTTPGEYKLIDSNGEEYFFTVATKQYPKSKITITDQNLVNPNLDSRTRIAKEQKLINAARATTSLLSLDSFKFLCPTRGVVSSIFGSQRIINGIPKTPHRGLDIAAAKGQEITAMFSGKVVLTGAFFYTGNTVFVDHGGGLVSFYAHLDELRVSNGSVISTTDVIGTVGKTGRATGYHLHLGTSLNGELFDPALLMLSNIRKGSVCAK